MVVVADMSVGDFFERLSGALLGFLFLVAEKRHSLFSLRHRAQGGS